MNVIYNGKEIDLDDNYIEGRYEFDTQINNDLEDTIELNTDNIINYQNGDDNG